MSLSQDLIAWEARLVELLEQTRSLNARVRQLEKQNQQLQQRNMTETYESGGLEALQGLYDEDFHICHAHFAEERDGADCLFCLSLMHNGLKKQQLADEEA